MEAVGDVACGRPIGNTTARHVKAVWRCWPFTPRACPQGQGLGGAFGKCNCSAHSSAVGGFPDDVEGAHRPQQVTNSFQGHHDAAAGCADMAAPRRGADLQALCPRRGGVSPAWESTVPRPRSTCHFSLVFVLWLSRCNHCEGFVVGELAFRFFFKNPSCFAVFGNQRSAKWPAVKGVAAQSQTWCRLPSVGGQLQLLGDLEAGGKPWGHGGDPCQPLPRPWPSNPAPGPLTWMELWRGARRPSSSNTARPTVSPGGERRLSSFPGHNPAVHAGSRVTSPLSSKVYFGFISLVGSAWSFTRCRLGGQHLSRAGWSRAAPPWLCQATDPPWAWGPDSTALPCPPCL